MTDVFNTLHTAAQSGRLEDAWQDIIADGTPIIDGTAATFVVRLSEISASTNLIPRLMLNRVTDKQHAANGVMQQVPGTDIWMRTLELSPTYRGSYGFHMLADSPSAAPSPTPGPNPAPAPQRFPTHQDPHARQQLDDSGTLSVVSGKFAPDDTMWARHADASKGSVITGQLGDVELMGYLPKSDRPCAVLTLFDAEDWFDRFHLPIALDAARDRGMGPVAVLGVRNRDNAHRMHQLRANADFLHIIATEGMDWLREQAELRTIELDEDTHIIAGQSLGGLSALLAGLNHPQIYSTVIAQSPSLWFSPQPGSTPRDLDQPGHGWLIEKVYRHTSTLPDIIVDVGAREGAMVNKAHLLEMALKTKDMKNTAADNKNARVSLNINDGGHDYAWWRVALMEHLRRLV